MSTSVVANLQEHWEFLEPDYDATKVCSAFFIKSLAFVDLLTFTIAHIELRC